MLETRTPTGWGIDEPACAVFEDGRFETVLGQAVYEIVMTDFEAQVYVATERVSRRSQSGNSNLKTANKHERKKYERALTN
jgi:cyanophycinase-like exopeptidase